MPSSGIQVDGFALIDTYAAGANPVTPLQSWNLSAHLLARCWGREQMTPRAEVLGNQPIGGEDTLGLPWGLESLHPSFPLTRGLGGVFGTVVQIAVLPMVHTRQDLTQGRTIALKLIRDDHPRHISQALQWLAEELSRRFVIPRRCTRIPSTGPS
jgi:hypothetical protein